MKLDQWGGGGGGGHAAQQALWERRPNTRAPAYDPAITAPPTPAAFQLAPAVTSQDLREPRKAATMFFIGLLWLFLFFFFYVHEFPVQMPSTLNRPSVVGVRLRASDGVGTMRFTQCTDL